MIFVDTSRFNSSSPVVACRDTQLVQLKCQRLRSHYRRTLGIMDRLDSLSFSAPVFFHLVRFFFTT